MIFHWNLDENFFSFEILINFDGFCDRILIWKMFLFKKFFFQARKNIIEAQVQDAVLR